jgi:hypothetical protein
MRSRRGGEWIGYEVSLRKAGSADKLSGDEAYDDEWKIVAEHA